jgi:hypothetical protein
MALALPFALLFVISIAALAASLFAVHQTRWLLGAVERRHAARLNENSAVLDGLRVELAEYERQLRDLEGQPGASQRLGVPTSGLNLSRRSQALRMHRRGEAPDQIAASLGVPRQEVDLLVKVHRIVVGATPAPSGREATPRGA